MKKELEIQQIFLCSKSELAQLFITYVWEIFH